MPDGVVMRYTKKYMDLPFDPRLKERAKALRKAGYLHEVLLWNQLKRGQFLGLDFDRQKIIGSYIVDFFCAEKSVVIELDGSSHEGAGAYDELRERFLLSLGLTVIRFSAKSVLQDMHGVMEVLHNHPALTGTPPKEGN